MPPPICAPRNTSAIFSPAPTMSPPTMAPGMEVNPPMMRTGKAFSARKVMENCTPSLVPHTVAATSATRPAASQTTNQSKPGEQHRYALRKSKDTGCLEDQPEAERDQRVQHAGHQSADQHFEKLTQRDHATLLNARRRDRRRSRPDSS